jgi:UDP-2,3-diacylglucosamine pyrophosphatase LpxH
VEHYRAVFLSDLHLGSRDCRAAELLAFLGSFETPRLYLLGDIIDLWSLRSLWYVPESHVAIINAMFTMVDRGPMVCYVLGNHDEGMDYLRRRWSNSVEMAWEAEHTTADGRRLLLVHGDAFDLGARYARSGARLYVWLTLLNTPIRAVRRLFRRRGHWSLAAFVQRSTEGERVVRRFEEAAATEARRRNYAGIVCGHVHRPAIREIKGTWYYNCGDGVTNCTALVEAEDGRLEIVRWGDIEGHG